MFYHQSILNRRGGVFGTVWLAATIKDEHILKRREVTSVNLCRTCTDILDFIMVRKQPSIPGRSRPRFSLYLSAKLMYGCVRLYKKQTQYLLEDISSFMVKVRLAANMAENIDLNIACRPDHVTLPDLVPMTTEKQPLFDPYFGRIDFQEDLSDAEKILAEFSSPSSSSSVEQLRFHKASESSSKQADLDQSLLKSGLGSPHTVSSLDQITLKDVDIPYLPQIPEQTELPALDEHNIQALLEESVRLDAPPQADIDLHPDKSSVKGSEAFISLFSPSKTKDGLKDIEEPILSPKEKTPRGQTEEIPPEAPPILRESRPRSPEVTVMPPPEEVPRRSSRKRQIDLSLELAPLPPSPSTRKRKRRHLIVDENIMISKAEMKKNLQNSAELCKPLRVPVIERSDCITLFSQPGARGLRCSPLLDMWRHNLSPGLWETESDIDTPFWTVPSISRDETSSTRSKRSRRAILPEPEEPRQDLIQPPEAPIMMETLDLQPPQTDLPEHLHRTSPEKARADVSVGHELSSMEILRDASVSMERSLFQEDITPVQLHLSARSKDDSLSDKSSSSRRRRSRSRGSIEEEILAPPSEPSVSDNLSRINLNLSVVPEETEIPMVETPIPVISKISQAESRFIRLVNSYTSEVDYTTFEEVCSPHLYDRKQAASMFYAMLHSCAKGYVSVAQHRPYEEILIRRGQAF
uniref:Meiotic recombination protein REC8 homolog n=1 Tax=Crassostrea virginica TaxID=6565 RepID=A0A8B8EFJ6_CRAVI|nr:meiotic recombination protein REC8 homolog [Crassostrea virginica]